MKTQKILKNYLKILRIVKNFCKNFDQSKEIIKLLHYFDIKIFRFKLICREFNTQHCFFHFNNFF